MFQLGKTIVSEDILEKDFVCNLSKCHGACCVDGDAGAPLSEEETKIIEEISYAAKFMSEISSRESTNRDIFESKTINY